MLPLLVVGFLLLLQVEEMEHHLQEASKVTEAMAIERDTHVSETCILVESKDFVRMSSAVSCKNG